MRFNRNPILQLEPASSASSRRRHGRVRCGQTKCTLGEVLDLSASGVRVLIRGRVRLVKDAVTPMVLEVGETSAPVKARVVWISKDGWFRHTAGLQFVDVTPEQRAKLTQIARFAGNNEYIRTGLDTRTRSA